MASGHTSDKGYIAEVACHRYSNEEVVVELAEGSKVGCSSRHCTLPVAAAGSVAGYCIGDAYYHGEHPALPADDDRSSCRRG